MAKKSKARKTGAMASMPATRTEFTPDYSNVKRDLKRIGTLAGTFFAILIVLSFFIR
jgi:G:T-mismatch repair DNA endonuclease (very short patch repair protein)